MNEERNLTDADVDAIVNALKKSVVEEFYADLGKGVWAYVKKAFFVAVIAIAAYGAIKWHT